MIQKFRRKFIAFATSSVFILLLLILGSINIANFTMVAQNADEVSALLAAEGGEFRHEGPQNPQQGQGVPQEGDRPTDGISPETRMSTRYFTVKVGASGSASMVAMDLTERTVSPEEALTWGASLAKPGKVGWTRTYFRYRCYYYDNTVYVSVIDFGRELSPSYRVLWGSVIGSLAGLVLVFLALIPLSKILVKPLETSIKKQQRFISDASHELKTPLTIISANNEILEMEHGASDSTEAITKQVSHMTNMVRNLNALARMDEGEKVILSDVDFSDLANNVIATFEPGFAAKNIKFTANIPAKLVIKTEAPAIEKLLSILLDNALKYAITEAEFRLDSVNERVAITVTNDAENIPDGSLDQVFERFYRSDVARASGIEGSGIGLSIAKQIVLNHNGRILAKGENGKFIIKAEF